MRRTCVLRTYVDKKVILEHILQNVKKRKNRAAKIAHEPTFLPFYVIIISLFSFPYPYQDPNMS